MESILDTLCREQRRTSPYTYKVLFRISSIFNRACTFRRLIISKLPELGHETVIAAVLIPEVCI